MGSTGVRTSGTSDDLVIRTIQDHADALLKLARRHSLCADDAYDAYQRGLELFLQNADRLDADRAHSWLFTVVKREAWSVREQRQKLVGTDDVDFDSLEARHEASPEDSALAFESVSRAAEALQRLKPQEVRALWLRASGRSYAEIAEDCAWSYTKVNRCLAEGRQRLLERYAEIESGEECRRWGPLLSAMVDGEASAADLAELRPHLINCQSCRASVRALHQASGPLGLVLPATLVVTAAGHEHADTAFGFIVRGYEAVANGLHERVVTSAFKLQAAADALSAGKVAAVAASAAALAGGGVVLQAHQPAPSRSRSGVAHDRAARRAASIRQASAPLRSSSPAAPVEPAVASGPAASSAAAVRSSPRSSGRTAPKAVKAVKAKPKHKTTSAAAAAAAEFSPDAVARPAAATRGPSANTPPVVSAAPSPKPSAPRSSAAAAQQEFSP